MKLPVGIWGVMQIGFSLQDVRKMLEELTIDDRINLIIAIDELIDENRPSVVSIGNVNGRIIYASTSSELYRQIYANIERLPTFRELMELRYLSFSELIKDVPQLIHYIELISTKENFQFNISEVKDAFQSNKQKYGIWQARLTSSTNMVWIGDKDTGSLYFFDWFPDSLNRIADAILSGDISDGGFKYTQDAIKKIISETPLNRKISWNEYTLFPGGNMSGERWLNHPVFSAAVDDRTTMINYVTALNILRSLQIIPQPNSGWCPREMKSGYGRPISLGFGADAFYPPNNTTLGHSALLLNK